MFKMVFFQLCIATLLSFLVLGKSVVKIKKTTFNEYESSQIMAIKNLNQSHLENGWKPIRFNFDLMDIAQEEAERLADNNSLLPITLDTDKNFYGLMFKIFGKIAKVYGIFFQSAILFILKCVS